MNDIDPTVLDVLDSHYPRAVRASDWDGVLRRSGSDSRHHRRRLVAVAACLLVAVGVCVPAFALSASVREFLGFPRPVYSEARLLVSAPLGDGRVVRIWQSPSDSGGSCEFTTYDPADTDQRPANTEGTGGGGFCISNQTVPPLLTLPLEGGVSIQNRNGSSSGWVPPIVRGRVKESLGANRVVLRWRTGSMPLAFRNNYFVGGSPALYRPPFDNLPYQVVAYDRDGHEVARKKLASRVFYTTGSGKREILPKLREFARQHRDRHINP